MHRGVARESFQPLTHIDELFHLLIRLIERFQLRILLQRQIERDVELCRHHLRHLVTQAVRKVHDTTHIADHTAGRQCTEGHDLSHLVFSVLFHDIVDDFLTALVAEVHVDIRHGDSFRV